VLLGDVERQVVVGHDTRLGRRVMLVHVGHVENGLAQEVFEKTLKWASNCWLKVSEWSATAGIIFSHSGLRYFESGGHPSTAGPDYNLDPPSTCTLATSSFELAGAVKDGSSLAPGHLRQTQGL
jgi:hypothetical protein